MFADKGPDRRDPGREFERMSAEGGPLFVDILDAREGRRYDAAVDVLARRGVVMRVAYYLARTFFAHRPLRLHERKALGFDLLRDLYQSLKGECIANALRPSASYWDMQELENFLFGPAPERRSAEQQPQQTQQPRQPVAEQRPAPTGDQEPREARRGRRRRGGRGRGGQPPRALGEQVRAEAQAPAPASPEPAAAPSVAVEEFRAEAPPQGDAPPGPEAE